MDVWTPCTCRQPGQNPHSCRRIYARRILQRRRWADPRTAETTKRWQDAHPERSREYYASHRAVELARNMLRRMRTLAAYGGRCEHCGETDRALLKLHHRNGGGRRDRAAGNRPDNEPIDQQKYAIYCCRCHDRSHTYGHASTWDQKIESVQDAIRRLEQTVADIPDGNQNGNGGQQ